MAGDQYITILNSKLFYCYKLLISGNPSYNAVFISRIELNDRNLCFTFFSVFSATLISVSDGNGLHMHSFIIGFVLEFACLSISA
jgi:hypothetical protein